MKTFPSTTAGPANPSPTFFCQVRTGPSFDHALEISPAYDPSRRGPKNCGQSSAAAEQHNTNTAMKSRGIITTQVELVALRQVGARRARRTKLSTTDE